MFNKEQLQRFSIRKLTVGAASVLIGVSLMTEMSNNKVYADVRTTNENSNSQVHDNSDGNTLNLSTDLKNKADEAGTADSEVTNNSNAKVGGDSVTDNSNARNVEIKNIDDSKKDQQSGDAVAPKEKTANTIQKHEENVAKGTTVDSNDLQVAKAQADLAATKINGKASSVVSPQIKQIQAKYQISKNLPLEKQINPTDENSDGKVVVKAEDPSNYHYPRDLNNLIGEDKYIYQVLSLDNDPDTKLILSVNRNDSTDKNIYAYVDNNGKIEPVTTVGENQKEIIDINKRGYQINNDGSSNIIIDGNKESTQNSSTVTSAPGYYTSEGGYYDFWGYHPKYNIYHTYSNVNPITQSYGLGSTTSNNCSAIGEIVPVFTKNSVIKYYYLDNEGHLQEFKNSELPNVSVEGFTGQEFEIDDVDQYEKVIQGYSLISAPTGNFKGTLSQFSDDKYYKKVYYDFGTNKVKYSVLYHQIYPDGTMEVWLVDGKGDALTETREIAPNTSTEFSNYNCTVRNPYVTAVQHEVQFIYSPDAQHMTITYIDDTTGKTLKQDKLDGTSDQDAKYTTGDIIKQYEDQHYKMVSDSTNGQDLIFDHDDNADQSYEVHFIHSTHTINQTTSPKQTIHYVYADGLARQGKAADDNVQQLSFKRDGYNDEVTGIDHWNAWTPANSNYSAVDSPVVQGYTPDKSVIEKSTVNPTDKDTEITVVYNADKQAARVIYIDKTTNDTLTSNDLSGESDKDSGYNTKDTIGKYQSQHYVLTGDETDGKNVIFDHDDKQNQTYYVYFVHGMQKVNRQDTVTSTIDYKFEDGKIAQPTVTQTKHFSEDGFKDLVTGKITWDEAESQKFDDIATKSIVGYTSDKDNVAGSTVRFGDKDIEVTVTYHNNAQKAVITYVDDVTKNTLASDSQDGKFDHEITFEHDPAEVINGLEEKGYKLVSNDFKDGTKYKADDKQNEFIVHLTHDKQKVNRQDQVIETIHYVYENGSKSQPDHEQTISFTEDGVKNKVTGQIDWTSATPQKFDDVATPAISGYTPDKDNVTGSTVRFGDKDIEVTVTYH
ncbi:MAG: YSIRK-type signal peptide-containing protein, partial [Lactobacillus gallinarum]|uniref:mucin-binding protein n=1 Tax=Lactobacillus gallinarum TaxID=52242 RepID=UPI0037F2C476